MSKNGIRDARSTADILVLETCLDVREFSSHNPFFFTESLPRTKGLSGDNNL